MFDALAVGGISRLGPAPAAVGAFDFDGPLAFGTNEDRFDVGGPQAGQYLDRAGRRFVAEFFQDQNDGEQNRRDGHPDPGILWIHARRAVKRRREWARREEQVLAPPRSSRIPWRLCFMLLAPAQPV